MEFMVNYFLPFFGGTTAGTFLFALYVENGNGMGKILFRPTDDGTTIFTFRSMFNLMIEPLKNSSFWKINNLDINYIFIATASGLIGVFFNEIIKTF